MAKFLLLFLTLTLITANNGQHGAAVATDDEGDDLKQRRETMAEVIRVFSNPVLAAAADAETTHRLWLFMKRELGPLEPILDAVIDMPEESDDDVRSKVEALHAVQGLMIQHFRPLLKPHRSGAKTKLHGLFMQVADVPITNKSWEASVDDL